MPDVVKFEIGQRVFSTLRSDVEGIVCGISFRPGSVIYAVTWSDNLSERSHYDFELSAEQIKEFKHND